MGSILASRRCLALVLALVAWSIGGCSGPELELDFSPVKQFDFRWSEVPHTERYLLLESTAPGAPFEGLGGDLVGNSLSVSMPLHFRSEASYVLRACGDGGCKDSDPVSVVSSLAAAVGYFKASNPGKGDTFGDSIALSGDGNTLAVGAAGESSINGEQADDSAREAGAVYVFARDATGWSQQAYLKASDPEEWTWFGRTVALSDDGDILAVGSSGENGSATPASGAAYVFERDATGEWSQRARIEASNIDAGDFFGWSVALGGDGDTLAVGALAESSNATGIDGDQADDSAPDAGAVYVFVRDVSAIWSQQAYIKASNTDEHDGFGRSVALSRDGDVLAISAAGEASRAMGIDGDQTDDSAPEAGAVYVFVRGASETWSQQAYVKASHTDASDAFGSSIALSDDGNTLGVGAPGRSGNSGVVYVFGRDAMGQWAQRADIEASNTDAGLSFGKSVALSSDGHVVVVGAPGDDSSATGIGGDQLDHSAWDSGAAYVFVRDAMDQWSQQAYVKASNTQGEGELDVGDAFGWSIALSDDAQTLAVGAHWEDGSASGLVGDQADDSASEAGAAYLY